MFFEVTLCVIYCVATDLGKNKRSLPSHVFPKPCYRSSSTFVRFCRLLDWASSPVFMHSIMSSVFMWLPLAILAPATPAPLPGPSIASYRLLQVTVACKHVSLYPSGFVTTGLDRICATDLPPVRYLPHFLRMVVCGVALA